MESPCYLIVAGFFILFEAFFILMLYQDRVKNSNNLIRSLSNTLTGLPFIHIIDNSYHLISLEATR